MTPRSNILPVWFETGLFFLLAMATAGAVPAESARDAFLRWRGGDAFVAMHSRHYRGDIQVAALKGTFECWEDAAGRYRFDFTGPGLKVSTRINESTGFSLTPGGQVETLAAADCERRLRSMLTSYASVLTGARGATLSPLPEEKDRDGVAGFRVQFPNGDLCEFHLGPNGELLRTRDIVDGEETLTTFGDWRMVNGLRLPYALESTNKADGQQTRIIVTQDQVNPEIDAGIFGRPEVESRLRFDKGASSSGVIPVELYAGSRLFLAGRIGDKPATMLLDSGAEVSLIDTAFARAAGIQATGQMNVRGTGGTENAATASDVSVTIGTMTLRTGMVLLMDLSQIAQQIDHPVQVVLGKEVLNQTVTDIDFNARTIRFHEPATFSPPAGMTRVPLTVSSGIRSVPIVVEGHEPVNADFDLGNGGALFLFPQAAAKWGLRQDRPVGHRLGGGVGGLRTEDVVTIKTLEIGGYTLRQLSASIPTDAEGLAYVAKDSVQANVGMRIWSRFHLVMDFGRNQLFISAPADALATPFAKSRAGMTVVREGDALKVLFVDSAFPKPVCKADAEIVAIDGIPVSAIDSATAWTERPAGTVVKLTFRDGHNAELTLQDYF